MGANGTATAALIFGGSSPARDETEDWNGVSWQETSDLNTGRKELGAAKSGTSTSSLAFGGEAPPQSSATEEWNVPSNVIKTLTD
jgi:hypothetical protein